MLALMSYEETLCFGLYFTRESLRLNGMKFIYYESKVCRGLSGREPQNAGVQATYIYTEHLRVAGNVKINHAGDSFSASHWGYVANAMLCNCKRLARLIDPQIGTVPPVAPRT